jgi:hypothetical protein
MALPPGVALLVLAVLTALPSSALGQTATLKGKIIDSELGDPVPGAVVRIKPGGSPLTADSLGQFSVAELKPGEIEVAVQALGFEPRSWKFTVQAGQAVDRSFSLDFTGEKLPEVVVTARANKLVPRYADFERRRERGIGAFMRWDDIKKKNFNTLGDAARSVRGVKLVCDQAEFECNIRMARTPNCTPRWYVDGVQVTTFHESTPVRDIYGLELYRGPSELPAEFSGSDGGCGVLAVWSKSKPYR